MYKSQIKRDQTKDESNDENKIILSLDDIYEDELSNDDQNLSEQQVSNTTTIESLINDDSDPNSNELNCQDESDQQIQLIDSNHQQNSNLQIQQDSNPQNPNQKRTYNKKTYEKVQRDLKSNKVLLSINKVPESFQETNESPPSQLWHQAMLDELKSHQLNKTWSVIEKPTDENINIIQNILGPRSDFLVV